MCGDLVGDDEQLLESLLTLRNEIEVQQALRDEAQRPYEALPHRRRYLLLNHELGSRLLQAHREWLAIVERELRQPDEPGHARAAVRDEYDAREAE
jgi:hypothetical protein